MLNLLLSVIKGENVNKWNTAFLSALLPFFYTSLPANIQITTINNHHLSLTQHSKKDILQHTIKLF